MFPYVILENMVNREWYEPMRDSFPTIDHNDSGRSGHDLYRDDPEFLDLMHVSPAWRHCQAWLCAGNGFPHEVAQRFKDQWPFSSWYVRDYIETRKQLNGKQRMLKRPKKQLFVRIDIQQGHKGYSKPMHLDHERRVASMVWFFCDQDECNMKGGELVLHEPDGTIIQTIEPRHNRAVIWLQARDSWHSVNEIVSTDKPRNFLYVTLSSTQNVWPKGPKRKTQSR